MNILHAIISKIILFFIKTVWYFTAYFTKHNSQQVILTDSETISPLCESLIKHFQKKGSCKNDIISTLNGLKKASYKLATAVDSLRKDAALYDFLGVPGNGYRSFMLIADQAQITVWKTLEKCNRTKNFNRYLCSELNELENIITSLSKILIYLIKLKQESHDGSLLHSQHENIGELLDIAENIKKDCFYGRFIAFQFSPSMRFILKQISWNMVGYSEIYYGASLVRAGLRWVQYAFDNDARAKRHVALIHHAGIDFTKGFWKLAECPVMIWPMLLTNPIAVSEEMSFPLKPFSLNGREIDISLPSASFIKGRLISKSTREGMLISSKKYKEKSNCLLVHVHGGGFVSQSARTQEIFLRKWAHKLDVPIFSIDYSLAPEAPFPQAVLEVFYGYCLAIANCGKLGTTAERVVFTGDSAGANLVLGAVQECIARNVQLPHGLFLAYVPVLVSFKSSPSRLLGLLDPLLPFGVMIRCAKAYVHGTSLTECTPPISTCTCADCEKTSQITFLDNPHLEFCKEHFNVDIPVNSYISPYEALDHVLKKMPPMVLCSATFDPCLDDTIMFAKKLQGLGKPVSLDIMEGLGHGFLNFCWVNENAEKATYKCCERIASLLNMNHS